jgi:hypothetical protein
MPEDHQCPGGFLTLARRVAGRQLAQEPDPAIRQGARHSGALIPERPTKTPTSAVREDVYENALIGDSGAARDRIREFKKGKPADVRAAIDEQVKDTLRSRQPIKAGGGSEAGRADFKKWMGKQKAPELGTKLPLVENRFTGEADVARVKRIDENYHRYAQSTPTCSLTRRRNTSP